MDGNGCYMGTEVMEVGRGRRKREKVGSRVGG